MLQLLVDRASGQRPISRRGFLRTVLSGGTALGLSAAARAATAGKRDTAVIQVWVGGGPSHIDMYDMKPEAPAEIRGPFSSIATNIPGLRICELLPRQARIMNHLALIRSLHHDHNGAHVPAIHCMQTGVLTRSFKPSRPSVGSVISKARGSNRRGMPAYATTATDPKHFFEGPPNFDASYLGPQHAPFKIHSAAQDPPWGDTVRFQTPQIQLLPGMDFTRLEQRMGLRERFDAMARHVDADLRRNPLDPLFDDAYHLLTDPKARAAFDLSREDIRVRERYGMNAWGQSALLCRRLVEAGVTFMTLNMDSSSVEWDHHEKLQPRSQKACPIYDQMLTALIEDLVMRGLYDRVLVLVWGEFGRSPLINKQGGREHWGKACFALMGGGGLKTGQIIGSTTSKGEEPKERSILPADILATVYRFLGIDPRMEFKDTTGRPIPILPEGEPVKELI
jgi:hypothetical protein